LDRVNFFFTTLAIELREAIRAITSLGCEGGSNARHHRREDITNDPNS
jgi:hypothetical protein